VRQAAGTGRQAPLRLIATDGRLLSLASTEPVRTTPAARAEPGRPATPRPDAPGAARTPVRLTRRGRLVVTAVAVLVIAAVSVVLAGAAQARGHSGGAAGQARLGAGITKVQVRPGQNLWTLAEAYDPNADPRQVIQEILQLNSMSTDQLQPGQVLWMPRD
jgi:nucleoid-associated protein YgaU